MIVVFDLLEDLSVAYHVAALKVDLRVAVYCVLQVVVNRLQVLVEELKMVTY